MTYTVLARKYRPQKFEDVVGQTHVSRSLTNAINMGRLAHAYLFSGTRGVGKTTTARILAKALNCGDKPTAVPCGECDSCREITQGHSVDVIEIDGASNTGVDNVRELRENVKYAPARGRYKVYIIDEVHMLSTAAFNALLKTLEEPPEHVVFIFATTDPHKVPATILSRCQHYDFRRVPKAQIEAHMKDLCEREGIKAEDAALSRLAIMAEGSVRDGLSLLDQVVSYCGEEGLKETDIDDILGLVGREVVKEAVRAITAQDAAAALKVVDELVDKGHDLRRFASTLLELYRDVLLYKVAPRTAVVPAAEIEWLKSTASGVSPDEIIRVMNLLTKLGEELRWTTNPRISVELALVKAASRPINTVDDILAGLKGLKNAGPSVAAARTHSAAVRTSSVREEPVSSYESPASPGGPVTAANASEAWERITEEVQRMGKAPLASKMDITAPRELKGNVLTVIESKIRPLKSDELALISKVAAGLFGEGFAVRTQEDNGEKKQTPAEMKKEGEKTRKEKMKQDALVHPLVKSAVDLFGAEIVEVTEE